MKTRINRIGSLFFFLLLAALTALPAGAQDATRLARVQVDLWPDYDQTAVLALVTAELPAETELPAQVSFVIPASAGEPAAVAYMGADGGLLTTDYETQAMGNSTLVTVEARGQTVRIEYYFPYTRSGNDVSFDYSWLGGVEVDDLTVLLQQPAAATSMNPDAVFTDVGILTDGNSYYSWNIGAVGVSDTRTATIRYTGPASLTVSQVSSAPASTNTTTTSSTSSNDNTNTLAVILAAAGGLLVGVGIGWYLPKRNAGPAPQRTPQPGPSKKRTSAFCHQCGNELKAEDLFCRKCGQRVK